MIQVFLVFTCEIQTSKADESQRKLLRDSFQKVLMNDSEQLLTLQQIFLTPRQKNSDGFYLYVNVTIHVEGTTTDDWYCDWYFLQYNLCVYSTSMKFEVLPPAADHDQYSTVKMFLNKYDIRMVLQVLDPSFSNLARLFQTLDSDFTLDGYYHGDTTDCQLTFYIHVDKIEITPFELPTDVHNALYLTLSWVSLKQ
jgi:hypothetical protein